MANDQIETMRQLGHHRFLFAGHDRGGRVAHRLCMDHPEAVEKVALLDIAPTLTMYNDTHKEFATKYVLVVPADSTGADAGTHHRARPRLLPT